MELDRFLAKYPRLYHVTSADAWPSIEENGLLSAATLVSRSTLDAAARAELLSTPRQSSVEVEVADIGPVTLRDQKTLSTTKLAAALTGEVTVEQYVNTLNDLVFFYPTTAALDALLPSYGDQPYLVLTVNTRSIVNEYRSLVRAATISTGATLYAAAARGDDVFKSVSALKPTTSVKEISIKSTVSDIANHVVRAERLEPAGLSQVLFSR